MNQKEDEDASYVDQKEHAWHAETKVAACYGGRQGHALNVGRREEQKTKDRPQGPR